MRYLTWRLAMTAAALALLTHPSAFGDTIVAPNGNTNTSGNGAQYGIFDSGAVTFQYAYNASQFAGISSGSVLTGIGFRLPANMDTFAPALNFSQYSISVGTATVPVESLSTNFAANVSADDAVVLSGPLTIPGGSLVGGSDPNQFYELVFGAPFVYHGGALVVTIRHNASTTTSPPPVDGNLIGTGTTTLPLTLVNSVAAFGSNTATIGEAGYFNVPITKFYFQPSDGVVPEPASIVSSGAAIAMMVVSFGLRRRRRHAA